jgi:hypothetical protein
MTEAEWLECNDPTPMLEYIKGRGSERKIRLLAVACCRTYSKYFSNEESWEAVEVASQVADGIAQSGERERAFEAAHHAANWTYNAGAEMEAAAFTCGTREQVNEVPQLTIDAFACNFYQNPRRLVLILLRCIFGNPLRPVSIDPAWLTSDVIPLARGIYEERAFDRLPILSDALQDAGCENEDILNHCRSEGPHVRGCWVIDMLLGKE